ncbi:MULTISPECIES: PadR family transcriptional regulator [Burkholderia]|uniref:Uncharacterized protein n=1 Tax=Burkholderia aenigmatica TaxID=2015348 RepID=A0A6J5J795_9BURK|nr:MULTISPECIES: PadR family transcriptional regulator [Burkholderia]CAB3967405.1 hypothetical protein BLA3211_04456 [Burkholderia aenigmatica]
MIAFLKKKQESEVAAEAQENWESVTIENSDAIVVIGDSHMDGYFSLRDKSAISLLSSLTKYQVKNFSVAGNDCLTMMKRIIDDEPYFDGKRFSDFNAKFAVIISRDNDQWMRAAGMRHWQFAIERLIRTVRCFGIEPILATEFRGSATEYSALRYIADKHNVMFVDSMTHNQQIGELTPSPFFGANEIHTGTRSNGILWFNIASALNSLPAPDRSLKIYRPRHQATTYQIEDLINLDNFDLLDKWKEISITHSHLHRSKQRDYDCVDKMSVGDNSRKTDEYFLLESKQSLLFPNVGLIEATLPGTPRTLDEVKIEIDTFEQGIRIFVHDHLDAGSFISNQEKYQSGRGVVNGAWREIGVSNEPIYISKKELPHAMCNDSISLLIESPSPWKLMDVKISYRGSLGKPSLPAKPVFREFGGEMLENPGLDLTDGWSIAGKIERIQPIDAVNLPLAPDGTDGHSAYRLDIGTAIGQSVRLQRPVVERRYRLTVWARCFPPAFVDPDKIDSSIGENKEFIDRSTYKGDTPITSATNDLKMLRLEYSFGNIIPNGGGIYMENFVPLIWAPISFDFVYPAFPRDNACFTFRCSAPSGEIQISKMSLREVR